MLKVSLRNLFAHKLRLLFTFAAVSLGVGFMSGTTVLTDTIGKTFDDLFADVNRGTDAFVRAPARFEDDFGGTARPRLDVSVLDTVVGADGVAEAEPFIQGYARIIDREGDPVGNPNFGAPTFGGNWGEVDELNPFTLLEGSRPPRADDEVVIDKRSADETGYEIGDTVRIETPTTPADQQEYELVGIARFGSADSPGGATYSLFTLDTAMARVSEPGKVDAVGVVAEDGVDQATVAASVQEAVGDDVEVLTGEQITDETQSDIREGFSFFSTFLLVFALIALVVGSFVIYNSFTILVAQRNREMALLRAVGASRSQVLRAVLFEAFIVGLLASALGIVFGIITANVLKGLMDALGLEIPATGTVVKPAGVISAMVAGVLVTVLAAITPAVRASRVPPLAAMRDVAVEQRGRLAVRIIIATLVLAIGVLSLVSGLAGDGGIQQVGIGVLLVFTAAVLYGPAFSRPAALTVGAPLPRLRGVTGTLARENAARNPKRTAATASAILIGVGIIAFFLVFYSSVSASIEDVVDTRFRGDLVVDSGSFGFGGLPTEVVDRIADLPDVDLAAGFRGAFVEVEDSTTFAFGAQPESGFELLDLGIVAGSASDVAAIDTIAVYEGRADDKDWSLGDEIEVVFPEAGPKQLRIAALYSNKDFAGDYTIGTPTLDAYVPGSGDAQIFVRLDEGVDVAEARGAIEEVTSDYASAELLDLTEFKDRQIGQFTPILGLIAVLLLVTIVIAILGIVNTLALSVIERTRELGLVRAVGGTRGQVRSMVRWEAVIVSLVGTFTGIAIGVFFGWCLVQALREEGLTTFVVPIVGVVVVVLIAAAFGLVAATYPAWRAGRLNVLDAIFDE
jgi:putative ABC transport system permease protein